MIRQCRILPIYRILSGANIMYKLFGTEILGGRAIAESPGNLYSTTQQVNITKDYSKVFSLTATKVVPEPTFTNTQYAKEIKAPSALLSTFLNKQMTVNGTVLLPKEYLHRT